jgi:hypothetical protein
VDCERQAIDFQVCRFHTTPDVRGNPDEVLHSSQVTDGLRAELKEGLRPLLDLRVGTDDLDIVPLQVQESVARALEIRNEVDQLIGEASRKRLGSPARRRAFLSASDNDLEMGAGSRRR